MKDPWETDIAREETACATCGAFLKEGESIWINRDSGRVLCGGGEGRAGKRHKNVWSKKDKTYLPPPLKTDEERHEEIIAHLRSALTHVTIAQRIAAASKAPYDYEADPPVPETEEALAIGHAGNLITHLLLGMSQ